jgi:glutathione S-transferase
MDDLILVLGSKNLSSWSLRPWLVLKHIGVDFTEVVIPLDHQDTAGLIRRHSEAGLVPVLHHVDLTVWDSLAITEYLAERFPESAVWPSDPHDRARARAAAAEMHSGFSALRNAMPMAFAERRPHPPDSTALDTDIRRILDLWSDLRTRPRADGPFLFGRFCAADAFFAPVVSRFRTYGVRLEGAAADYADRIWQLDAMQQWLADARSEI